MNGRDSHVSRGRTPAGWWVVLAVACIASAVVTHLGWGPEPWQVPRYYARQAVRLLHELESGRILPGVRTIDVAARNTVPPKSPASDYCYIGAPTAAGKVFYNAGMYYTGSEWMTVYSGGDETRYIAVVRGGRGTVNGERWYFCDFEGLRTYIEGNMRRRNNDRSDK